MNKIKPVDYGTWCPKCEHYDGDEADDPCWSCMSEDFNVDSTMPVRFSEKRKRRTGGE